MVLHSTSFSAHRPTSTPFGGTTSGFSFPIQKESDSPSGPPAFGITSTPSPSYVATRDRYSHERIHSISAMPAYLDKSHEELRFETYQQRNKGDHKTSTPNIFNQSSPNSPFQPFKSNLPPLKLNPFSIPNTTISTTPTLSLFSQSQPYFTSPSSTCTLLKPFPSTPFRESTLVNSDQCRPNVSTTLMTPSSSLSMQSISYPPFKSNLSAPKTANFITTMTNTLSPSVNPLIHTNLYPSQSQPSIPRQTAVSSTPTFPPTLNHCPNISTSHTTPSTSVTLLDSWSFTPRTSQLGPTNDQSQPSQCKSISTTPTFSLSQPSFTSPSSTCTCLKPFPSTPFHESTLVNSDQCPNISTTLMTPSYPPFKSNLSAPKTTNFINTMTNNTLSPSVNPLIHTNLYPSQSHPSTPTFPPTLNLSSLDHCPNISTTHTAPSTSVTPLDSWPFTPMTSQLGPTNDQSQPSQCSNDSTKVVEFSSQTMNVPQHISSSLVANPFATETPTVRPNAVTSSQYGISSLPVSNNLSTNRRMSLLRIRHVASKHPWLPSQGPSDGSRETKVPFFLDEVDKPVPAAPFLPRVNPRAWIKNPFSLHSHSNSKCHEDNEISTEIIAENHKDEILATMPKLPEGGYYTEPSVKELAAKEMAEPGWCTRVNNFVVGRRGYGSIKILEETDVRNLHLDTIVQFNDREVIVYPDEEQKPPVGQSLNKPCEVTLLNVKCIDKKTGKLFIEGRRVQRYKEMLMNKCSEQGAEFVSYDPVLGEWRFRVQHF